jgi:SAM-dependent MidA family methyltransferase
MTADVARYLREAIRERGPMTFAEFMDVALYAPGGFYDVPPVGTSGHFVTSPHVHAVFGELLASGLRRMWLQLGRPSPYRVIEVGAGDGTLARQLLEHLSDIPVAYVAVERSARAREILASVPGVTVFERLDDLGPVSDAVILANELLDVLPFRRVRIRPGGVVELLVGLDLEDRFVEIESPCDAMLAASIESAQPEQDVEVAVPVAALTFVDVLARTLVRGWALLIDYGSLDRRALGGPRGYRSHRLLEDVLLDPGSTDITAEVDFAAVEAAAARARLRVDGLPSQREALFSLGMADWARGELGRQGALLRDRAGLEAARAWSGRGRATLLIDPAALGRLRWLVLARDVPAPDWMTQPGSADPRRS